MARPVGRVVSAALAFFLLLCAAGIADDWTAVRLRGPVFVYHDGWVKLERGDVVSDDSIIRTLQRGRVSFERGAETIDLMPNSQIRIVDKVGGHRFTTVMSDYGKVAIEAEVENVQHFAVATPFLAAVVKGTKFTVSSTETGSEVEVQRGHVFVEASATHETTTISQGQTATASAATTTSDPGVVASALVVTLTPIVATPPAPTVEPSEPSVTSNPPEPGIIDPPGPPNPTDPQPIPPNPPAPPVGPPGPPVPPVSPPNPNPPSPPVVPPNPPAPPVVPPVNPGDDPGDGPRDGPRHHHHRNGDD